MVKTRDLQTALSCLSDPRRGGVVKGADRSPDSGVGAKLLMKVGA